MGGGGGSPDEEVMAEEKAVKAEAKCWIVLQNPVKLVLGCNVTEARGKYQEATQLTKDKSLMPA